MNPLVNIAFNQVVWFLCILGGNAGAVFALPLLVAHILLSPCRRADGQMLALLLFIGTVVDGILQAVGFISFTSPGFPIPLWLAVVWAALAFLPHHSLSWMKKRPLLSALFGALGGPLAYWAGVRLGAASFHLPLLSSLGLMAAIWALLWTVVMWFAAHQKVNLSSGRLSGT